MKIQTRVILINKWHFKKPKFIPQIRRFFMWFDFKELKISPPFRSTEVVVSFDNLADAEWFIEKEILKLKQKTAIKKKAPVLGPNVVSSKTHEL